MYLEILKAIWVFLPAAVANSVPVLAKKYNWVIFLDKPLDFGKSLNGIRVLGDHKTWRGLILGISAGIITAILQQALTQTYSSIDALSLIDWETHNPVMIGALLGSGALVGDALKSFLKRRLTIKPGESFFIFDQIDYILGALVFVSLKIPLSSLPIITIIITWTVLHVLSTLIAWKAGIKEKAI